MPARKHTRAQRRIDLVWLVELYGGFILEQERREAKHNEAETGEEVVP